MDSKKITIFTHCKDNHPFLDEIKSEWNSDLFSIEWNDQEQTILKKNEIFISDSIKNLLTLNHNLSQNHIYISNQSLLDTFQQISQTKKDIPHIIDIRKKEIAKKELLYTLKKIHTPKLTGLDQYLKSSQPDVIETIRNKKEKDQILENINIFLFKKKLPSVFRKHAESVANELMMNALFDAPKRSSKPEYKNKDHNSIELLPEDQITVNYNFDHETLGILVRDSFGSLKKDIFFYYLKKIMVRNDQNLLIDTKKEGAGLGLFKILFFSHGLSCTVIPGNLTEMMAVIHKDLPIIDFKRAPRSLHFFETD